MNGNKVKPPGVGGGTAELFMRLTKTVYVAVTDRAERRQSEMKYLLHVNLLHAS